MLYHFYDPVHQRGFTSADISMSSSKEWSQTASIQAKYDPNYLSKLGTVTQGTFSASSDYSWERAIYEYAWGDKTRGLESLGHILHLLEDATVPEHTRNDPHPHIFGMGSPYEDWTDQYTREAIHAFEELRTAHPVFLSSLDDYFNSMAQYSNNHFLSKDTIKNYDLPKIPPTFSIEYKDGTPEYFAYSFDDLGKYRLVKVKKSFGDKSLIIHKISFNKIPMQNKINYCSNRIRKWQHQYCRTSNIFNF